MRVVVTGLVASFSLGGLSWSYLGYVEGFRRLGFDVLYLEDTGRWFYDPATATFREDATDSIRYLAGVLGRLAPGVSWSLRGPDGVHHGLGRAEVDKFCAGADLFLNVSGSCWLREAHRRARRTVYLDTDPGYSHAKLDAVARGVATEEEVRSVALIRAHDRFFTYAENFGRPDCPLEAYGLSWRTTRSPIVLDQWPVASTPEADRYTTVMSWKTDQEPPRLGTRIYAGKEVEFARFLDLPARTEASLEIAVAGSAPVGDLRRRGWSVVDAASRTATPEAYRSYLVASRGEWSVAKNVYVATHSGWFSERTACYLALGKPAVVQETGFSRFLPTGEGLFAFGGIEEAVAALAAIEADYRRHCDAARALAEQAFDATTVLTRLCRDAGL